MKQGTDYSPFLLVRIFAKSALFCVAGPAKGDTGESMTIEAVKTMGIPRAG